MHLLYIVEPYHETTMTRHVLHSGNNEPKKQPTSMTTPKKTVEIITHHQAKRKNIPTAEYQAVMRSEELAEIQVAYQRRNRDLDPQLVWRGKDDQDWSDLVVQTPPLYIQEKVHPKILIDDLRTETERREAHGQPRQLDLFGDFNGLPSENARTEFYQHDANWTNRMILGDSLQVMASLAEREGLRGKVQCIYLDPPYGIKFNSNFQWSTTSRDVKDGNAQHITREPEQVKAFRDTWRDGIHSYLTYLRDRLTVARDLLTDSGSIFVQIGDENVHRVRALMDEIFGDENSISQVTIKKTTSATSQYLAGTTDYLLWYAKHKNFTKYHAPLKEKEPGKTGAISYNRIQNRKTGIVRPLAHGENHNLDEGHLVTSDNLTSQSGGETTQFDYLFEGKQYSVTKGGWKTNLVGMDRLQKATRLTPGGVALRYVRRIDDYSVFSIGNLWEDMSTGSFTEEKRYVVQTAEKIIQRCILMSTDPGDLVLDPTCGSGTTAYVAEQWGRRWITIDTSRVALALARARIMGARYSYYLLADSPEGQQKEAELTRTEVPRSTTTSDIRQGFVYERVPHITLKSIANNTEIDVIWEHYQKLIEPLRQQLNSMLKTSWQEWEIPHQTDTDWPEQAQQVHRDWWQNRLDRQREIDASIAAKADVEYLYDKPYEDKRKVRVAGPFTVETLSPHRVLGVDENDELIDPLKKTEREGSDQPARVCPDDPGKPKNGWGAAGS